MKFWGIYVEILDRGGVRVMVIEEWLAREEGN